MLPPLLTHDIIQGLKQFLITGFEPSIPFFQGLMQRYVADEQAWQPRGTTNETIGQPFSANPELASTTSISLTSMRNSLIGSPRPTNEAPRIRTTREQVECL
jgi:hypothetical protein